MEKITLGPKAKDLTGRRFGKLVAEFPAGRTKDGSIIWRCSCDCGGTVEAVARNLISGNTQSCGCRKVSMLSARTKRHGRSKHSIHNIWCNMLQRCENRKSPSYPRYGGRGIFVCDRWQAFENFLADMGERPSLKHSIDRIDNDGPYSPENCRWATHKEQLRNFSKNHLITYNGRTQCLADWADEAGIKRTTLYMRLTQYGWSVDKALST